MAADAAAADAAVCPGCGRIPDQYFPSLPPDPHRLDGSDGDGIGCESD